MFIRKDTPTVMSGLVVRYQLESDIYSGEINASRDGVSLCGRWPIMSADESVMVEETLARARLQAQQLGSGALGARQTALSEAEIDRVFLAIPAYEAGG
jgi:hypothetical protein